MVTNFNLEILGGKMWFESIEGCGSTFYFFVPLLENSISLPENTLSIIPDCRGKIIVIIDSSLSTLSLLHSRLSTIGK